MKERAESVVKAWLGHNVGVTGLQPLFGGMICDVLEVAFDVEPFKAVLKLKKAPSASDGFAPPDCSFADEADALRYLRRYTNLRVPTVFSVCEDELENSHLLMERLPGVNLEQLTVSDAERAAIETQMADDLLALHAAESDRYGPINGERSERWVDVFGPIIASNFQEARALLDEQTVETVPSLLEVMPQILGGSGRPSLVHGDVWAANVLVDRGPAGPRVTGWIDPAPLFADVEFELAYIAIFDTGGPSFFERYHAASPPRRGFELRRQYYWLNTMLLHCWVFGHRRYVERAAELARHLVRKVL